ncbi:MAG: hypothetical protein ABFS14_06270 [Gemmatimonadota bacterium]
MFLELAEALACPLCGPPQGLIVLVDQMAERRVSEGRLDCPNCETRFPIEAGVVFFGGPEAADCLGVPAPASHRDGSSDPAAPGRAVLLAALLGLHEVSGYVLLGPTLETVAAELSRLAGESEFVLLSSPLAGPLDARARTSRVSVVRGTRSGRLPLLNNRLTGAGLAAAPPDLCLAAYAAVRPGANLAVLDPLPDTQALLVEAGAQILAAEDRGIAARRAY